MRKGAVIILFVVMAAMLVAQVDALAFGININAARAGGIGPGSRASTFTAHEEIAVDNENAQIGPWSAGASQTSVVAQRGVAAARASGDWGARASSISAGAVLAVEV